MTPEEETKSGTLFEAIDRWADAKNSLSKEEIKERAMRGIRQEMRNGVQYIRTHVDVTEPKLTALKALLELREEMKDRLYLQIIAFPQEGYYAYRAAMSWWKRRSGWERTWLAAFLIMNLPESWREICEKGFRPGGEI